MPATQEVLADVCRMNARVGELRAMSLKLPRGGQSIGMTSRNGEEATETRRSCGRGLEQGGGERAGGGVAGFPRVEMRGC